MKSVVSLRSYFSWTRSRTRDALLARRFTIHNGMEPPTIPCWTMMTRQTLGAQGTILQRPIVEPRTAFFAPGDASMMAAVRFLVMSEPSLSTSPKAA
jgi:hypothetical protein